MIDVTTKKTIVFHNKEVIELMNELEDAFCLLDSEQKGAFYSGNNIREKHPKMWQLFNTLKRNE